MESREQELLMLLATNLYQHFYQVVCLYQHRLYTFALRLTGSSQDAEDIVQEAFVSAYVSLENYPVQRIQTLKLQAWLYRVTFNVYTHSIRRAHLQLVPLNNKQGCKKDDYPSFLHLLLIVLMPFVSHAKSIDLFGLLLYTIKDWSRRDAFGLRSAGRILQQYMQLDTLQFLRLLQLADSALPIGATAHSFGLETLTIEEHLETPQLESFLGEYIRETGGLEAAFCRLAHRLIAQCCENEASFCADWGTLNVQLDAYKTARENRIASTTLGRRFLQLVTPLTEQATLSIALRQTKKQNGGCHYCTAFGLTGAALGIDEDTTVLAYLHQSLAGLISACQRLLPLGQSRASAMLWRLKSTILEVATTSEALALHPENIAVCTPLLDLGSMRHPYLMTRLFIN